jgi:hypothetical protein
MDICINITSNENTADSDIWTTGDEIKTIDATMAYLRKANIK